MQMRFILLGGAFYLNSMHCDLSCCQALTDPCLCIRRRHAAVQMLQYIISPSSQPLLPKLGANTKVAFFAFPDTKVWLDTFRENANPSHHHFADEMCHRRAEKCSVPCVPDKLAHLSAETHHQKDLDLPRAVLTGQVPCV